MAKNKISEFSATAADNTDITNINIAEGCSPANVNNAIRSLMSVLKNFEDGSSGDNVVVGGNLSVTGTTTLVGTAIAPTPSSSDNSTKIATTAFVQDKVGTLGTMSTQNATAVAITGGTITGLSSPLPVASGGTGATTATGTGAIVLDTSPTLVTPNLGTPSTLVGTNITGTSNALNAGLGVNQTWQDVTSSRIVGTTYTNSTGKPIFISVTSNASASTNNNILVINSVNVAQIGLISGSNLNVRGNFYSIIPNGSTYAVTGWSNGSPLQYWFELR
jgi:hypothetical protein